MTVPVPLPRAPAPLTRHSYSFAVGTSGHAAAKDLIVGHVEKVGGLAICRMGYERLCDPVADSAARSYSRRRVPEGIPLEIAPFHLVVSPRGRMNLRDLEVTKHGPSASEMEGTTLAYGPATRRRPRTAPPALARNFNEYGFYEGPPANHAFPREPRVTAAHRRLVLQPASVQPPWTARHRDGRSNFERHLETVVKRRSAPDAWPRPPRNARGPSSPPLHQPGQREQRRPFASSRAATSSGA